jgi:hypothetical protein
MFTLQLAKALDSKKVMKAESPNPTIEKANIDILSLFISFIRI